MSDAPAIFLKSAKLHLRPLTPADVSAAYVSWLNDEEVTRYLEAGRYPVSKEDILARLGAYGDHSTSLIFGIFEPQGGRHIGNVTLNNINRLHGTADTGILIGDRNYWGRGYAKAAWSLVIDYAFRRLALRKMEAGVVFGNTGSEKALRALGFVQEGVQRRHFFSHGEYRDVIRFGLLPEEFKPCH